MRFIGRCRKPSFLSPRTVQHDPMHRRQPGWHRGVSEGETTTTKEKRGRTGLRSPPPILPHRHLTSGVRVHVDALFTIHTQVPPFSFLHGRQRREENNGRASTQRETDDGGRVNPRESPSDFRRPHERKNAKVGDTAATDASNIPKSQHPCQGHRPVQPPAESA